MQQYQYQQYVEPLDPTLFTSSETVTLDKWWQPPSEPVFQEYVYWIGDSVLVTTASEVTTAEVRVESWMPPPAMPEYDLLPQEGFWTGVLEPTLLAVPEPDTWFNETQHEMPPQSAADILEHPSFFWNPADFTAAVPDMDSWYVEPQQPYFTIPQTPGAWVCQLPPSLLNVVPELPHRMPRRDADDELRWRTH